uniref:NMDA receptor-regulated protein 2 n=2 Tax=Schizaphis graminum TaxID=13262 RepID=A0A2S2NRB6_SCHGA
MSIPTDLQNQQKYQTPNSDQQNMQKNVPLTFDPEIITPLYDVNDLYQNALFCQNYTDFCFKTKNQKSKKKDKFQITTQFLFGHHKPPYCSVLNHILMNKLIVHLKNPNCPTAKTLEMHKGIIEQEREIFKEWLSNLWEENLKNRRLNSIPFIESYIESACNFSNNYIKSQYSGTYSSKMKIDYYIRDDNEGSKVEMIYCKRLQSAKINSINLPPLEIDIKNLETKVSFTDGMFVPPQKIPFKEDEHCPILSKTHSIDVNICLSSMKNIMNLEKPNSLWIIPVNIDIDIDECKTVYVGGALCTGHFSQQEKSWYYLRKELKKKFIKTLPNDTVQNQYNNYNYDKWMLKVTDTNGTEKSLNVLVRNKPHGIQHQFKPQNSPTVLMPKIEYQPEFGFEKVSEEQLVENWLDTRFRCPKTKLALVSVQHNMDLMQVKWTIDETESLSSNGKDQKYLQRLYLTLDKLTQLGKGEYVLLHNPKKPFHVDLYQSSMYGGFNLLNMYYVLQQTDVSDSLVWNPIDSQVLCPIHKYFNIAPCMFRPNPEELNIQIITQQVNKYNRDKKAKEDYENARLQRKRKIKMEKNKIKRKLRRESDILYKVKSNIN